MKIKENIQNVKNRLRRKGQVSARKRSVELDISERSVRRILKVDLELRSYKKIFEPALSDDQKKIVCELFSNNFRKEKLFSDEKLFDIDIVYNYQNERVWTVDRHSFNSSHVNSSCVNSSHVNSSHDNSLYD